MGANKYQIKEFDFTPRKAEHKEVTNEKGYGEITSYFMSKEEIIAKYGPPKMPLRKKDRNMWDEKWQQKELPKAPITKFEYIECKRQGLSDREICKSRVGLNTTKLAQLKQLWLERSE